MRIKVTLECRKCGIEISHEIEKDYDYSELECPNCGEENYQNLWIKNIKF